MDCTPIWGKAILPSMRAMQFAGDALNRQNERMYNCSFTLVDKETVFHRIFYNLLCGCGVGYSVQWKHVSQLIKVKELNKKVEHYIVQDTLEGWVEALKQLIWSYFYGGNDIEFSYHLIRSEGTPLITSGGLAPGHKPLKRMLEKVRGLLDRCKGRKLRPIECHDLICFIAEAVLAGGIRRSSLICLFDASDTEMLYAKSPGVFSPIENLNSQRALANNSVVLDGSDRSIFDRCIRMAAEGYGEPGIFFGKDDEGCNPCGEIGLDGKWGFGYCNLVEINGSKPVTEKTLRYAVRLGLRQRSFDDFKYRGLSPDLGISITGMMENSWIWDNLEWMRGIIDSECSQQDYHSHRRCCIKPSGTASLLLGCSAGISCHPYLRYIRRVRANINEPAAKAFAKANPHLVEKINEHTIALKFFVKGKGQIQLNQEQYLYYIEQVYEKWIKPKPYALNHGVSCSVPIDDLEKLIDWVWEKKIRSMTFVPRDLGKKYPFMPQEEVDEFEEVNDVDWQGAGAIDRGAACEGTKCEIDS